MGCILVQGTMELLVAQGRQDVAEYSGMLERSSLFTERARFCGEDLIFQQDNAAINTARRPKYFFQADDIRILDHLACSP